jgi:hypothetical protein
VAFRFIRRLLRAFPSPPKRRYDLIGEAITKPFGGGGGRGAVRAGGVEGRRGSRSDEGADWAAAGSEAENEPVTANGAGSEGQEKTPR